MTHNIDVTLCYQKFDNFKMGIANKLINTFANTRINKLVRFKSYATITFADNDIQRMHPIVDETENFNRNKTNCLVFKVLEDTEENHGYYKYLYIYNGGNAGKDICNLCFVINNNDTGVSFNKYCIGTQFDNLLKWIHITLANVNKIDWWLARRAKDKMIDDMRDKVKNRKMF